MYRNIQGYDITTGCAGFGPDGGWRGRGRGFVRRRASSLLTHVSPLRPVVNGERVPSAAGRRRRTRRAASARRAPWFIRARARARRRRAPADLRRHGAPRSRPRATNRARRGSRAVLSPRGTPRGSAQADLTDLRGSTDLRSAILPPALAAGRLRCVR